jgi:LSD1 subclass zinc finger protein
VKYVCCGGCRQWLMAPRDAVYVVCAQCDSINNCNLAPKVRSCLLSSGNCALYGGILPP